MAGSAAEADRSAMAGRRPAAVVLRRAARCGHQPSSAVIGRTVWLSGGAVTAAQWWNAAAPGVVSA
jgi:hypothetical protein